jgi:hypothetical protein
LQAQRGIGGRSRNPLLLQLRGVRVTRARRTHPARARDSRSTLPP